MGVGDSLEEDSSKEIFSRFEFDQGHVLRLKTLVAHPLCVYFLGQVVEGSLGQAGADSMEPEVAARLAKYGLVVIVYLFATDSTGVDGGCVGVLRVENHRLAGRIYFLVGH